MPKALVFYHYFHPDDVVSSVHISELCVGLVERGWDVRAMPCNRGCRDETRRYPARETWKGISIRRIWRPNLKQSSSAGRALNALWMLCAWSLRALLPAKAPDVVIVGTDPILSVLTSVFWKLIRPKTRIVHWCFDLYPEAAIADDVLRPDGWPAKILQRLARSAYRRCDAIVDIGACMRAKLAVYGSRALSLTLTPWALTEPPAPAAVDRQERHALFGDAALAIMYSGNFGRAHAHRELLELARALRGDSVRFVFSVRGNRERALRDDLRDDDVNVHFAPFAPADALERRLSAADIHVVSLRAEWTGAVVPSKFFGALAVGRPVLFVGAPESAVAAWIRAHEVGWVLTADNIADTAATIQRLIADPGQLERLRSRCFNVYASEFSRETVIDGFDVMLRSLASSQSERGFRPAVQEPRPNLGAVAIGRPSSSKKEELERV